MKYELCMYAINDQTLCFGCCRLQKCVVQLEKEINLEYDRTMNRMVFEKVVKENPEKFSHITVPQREPETVPERGGPLGRNVDDR